MFPKWRKGIQPDQETGAPRVLTATASDVFVISQSLTSSMKDTSSSCGKSQAAQVDSRYHVSCLNERKKDHFDPLAWQLASSGVMK